ncbi:MAG: HpcH/HpaI aldolase/citrate lyase family protein [Desulfobacteria bacterium]
MTERSFLFVPGIRPDRFDKAWNSGADGVILDLEDAVPADRKGAARQAVMSWMSADRPVFVRVNGAGTDEFGDDVAAIARPGLAGVLLPKAERVEEIAALSGGLAEGTRIVPIVETAAGVWNVMALASAPRVHRLAFGSLDFQLDVGIEGEDIELLYARSRIVLASRAAGIRRPLDGVTTSIEDGARLAADVDRARRLGFGGKLCIHPRQVQAVNRGFAPTEEEIAWARNVLGTAGSSGEGAFRLDGEMVDRPVIERAKAIVERAGK